MLERSPRTPPRPSVHLGVIAVVMGTMLRLAAESVGRRLLLIGYQQHLSVREDPLMKTVQPSSMVGTRTRSRASLYLTNREGPSGLSVAPPTHRGST